MMYSFNLTWIFFCVLLYCTASQCAQWPYFFMLMDIGVQISVKTLWRQNGTSQGLHIHQKTQREKGQAFINASNGIPSKDPNFWAVNVARDSDQETTVTGHFVASIRLTCVSGCGLNNFGSEFSIVSYFLCPSPNCITRISASRFSIKIIIDNPQTNTRISP